MPRSRVELGFIVELLKVLARIRDDNDEGPGPRALQVVFLRNPGDPPMFLFPGRSEVERVITAVEGWP